MRRGFHQSWECNDGVWEPFDVSLDFSKKLEEIGPKLIRKGTNPFRYRSWTYEENEVIFPVLISRYHSLSPRIYDGGHKHTPSWYV